jgi:uncharacterized repeat protein (TIGR02543 family)
MKRLKSRAAVILLITLMCFSVLLSANIIKITPVKGYLTWGDSSMFNHPSDVFVDHLSYVYVADALNNRILKFDSSGNPVGSPWVGFNHPYGIGGDALYVYVADTYNNRILKFDSGGVLQTSWGTWGTGNNQFEYPDDVAADNSGYVYVTDHDNNRVLKFDNSGNPVGSPWGLPGGASGDGNGEFHLPWGIACDSTGHVYVVDNGNNRVQVFASDGTFLGKWGTFGTSGDDQFNSPLGIAVDGAEVYVADVGNNRIQKFYNYIPPTGPAYIGVFNWKFGSQGSGQDQFSGPNGVALDNAKNIYVADTGNDRIQKFSQYTLTTNKVDPSGQNYNYVLPGEGSAKYPEGLAVSITAIATHDYVFTGWSGSLSGIANPTTITMDGDKTVTANFAEPFRASHTASPPLIDGLIDLATEWNDANSYAITLYGGLGTPISDTFPATVYFKHDGTNIYIGLKVNAPNTHAVDEFALFFDEGNDGAFGSGTRDGVLTPNQEDMKAVWDGRLSPDTLESGYYAETNGQPGPWSGSFLEGGDFAAACSFVTDHWEVEFSIPFHGKEGVAPDLSNLNCGISDVIGLKIQYFTQPTPNPINHFYPAGDQYQIATYTTLSFNLLQNPGFENGLNHWSTSTGTAVYTTDDSAPHSGAFSCRGVEIGAGSLGRLYQDVTGVTSPRSLYQISGWIKTSRVTGSVVIGLDYVNTGGATPADGYVKEIGHVSGTQGWTFFQSDVFSLPTMPSDAQALRFLFDFNNGAGTAWFDDVSLTQVSGMTVSNVVDVPPRSDWSYLLGQGETVVEEFSIPAAGGSIPFPNLDPGTYWLAQTNKFDYGTSVTVDGIATPATTIDNVTLVTLSLGPSETTSVVFTNTKIPDAAWAKSTSGGDTSQSVMMTYQVPSLRPIPVQAGFKDIPADQRIDLVKNKPMSIIVNLTDLLSSAISDPITVSVTSGHSFTSLSRTTSKAGIQANKIMIFNPNPPSVTGDDVFTCTITYGANQATFGSYTTLVTVKETSELALYYSYLYRKDSNGALIDYGTEPAADFSTMITNTRDFINAVYPVPGLTVDSNSQGLAGNAYEANYVGMLKDCQYIAQQAKLRFPNSPNPVGIAIGPNSTYGQGKYQNYFAYHGAVQGGKTAVGVSFGPGVKGVVVLDGYYSAAAHEIGHTFGLYYGVPEEYVTFNPGMPSNGYYPAQNQWRAGYDFMGLSPYKSTTTMWVNTSSTYEPIFASLKTPNDPQILLVNGIIYDNGAVELPFTWYSMPYGTPDTVPTGESPRFALRFTLADGSHVETSFDAQNFLNLDPGTATGEDLQEDFTGFGTIPTNFAGFAFATTYPQGTVNIELLDKTLPVGNQVIKTISPASVVNSVSAYFGGFLQPINADGSSQFKLGSTVPIKFQLKGPQGEFITTATARLYTAKIGNSVLGSDAEAVSNSVATTGNLFRYDPINNQYVFNLGTKSMSKGTWQIKVTFDDGISKTVQISLK